MRSGDQEIRSQESDCQGGIAIEKKSENRDRSSAASASQSSESVLSLGGMARCVMNSFKLAWTTWRAEYCSKMRNQAIKFKQDPAGAYYMVKFDIFTDILCPKCLFSNDVKCKLFTPAFRRTQEVMRG